MSKLEFDPKEKVQAENIIKAINKAKFSDLGNMEIFALTEALKWLGSLPKRMEDAMKEPEQKVIDAEVVESEQPKRKKKTKKS
jgi:hypothetical protein